MKTEVRGPCRVHDQRHVVGMRDVGERRDVADRADIRRIADEHRPRLRMTTQRLGHPGRRDAARQPDRRVDLRAYPHGREPGEHQAEQHRPVQGAADDHRTVAAAVGVGRTVGDGQRQRLISVACAAHGKAADIRTPQPGGPGLGVGEHTATQLHRVQTGVQRHVAGNDVADDITPLFVAGDGERCRRILLEPQPRIQQRGV
nr:hypothetical protein [Mycolicibacterium mageritense]